MNDSERVMELVADRFVRDGDGNTRDLVTGASVRLIVSSAGGITEQRLWVARCDLLASMSHPALAALVDYGLLGEHQRFEAWRCDGIWQGGEDAATHVRRSATHLLAACGLSAALDDAVWNCDGRAVVVPDGTSAYVPASASAVIVPDAEVFGVSVVHRDETTPLVEILSDDSASRPRVAAIWGPPGSGVTTVLHGLARYARLRGLVPVSLAAAGDHRFTSFLAGRSIVIIGAPPTTDAWRVLVDRTSRSPLPHVMLIASVQEVARVAGIPLSPLTEDALIGAVRPAPSSDLACRRVRDAASRAAGLPGRFVSVLWGTTLARANRSTWVTRAAESMSTCGPVRVRGASESGPIRRAWPAPGEVATLRRRASEAAAAIARGRHASGHRRLRAATAALVRRGDWEHAAHGALTLGGALLRRGRPRDAQKLLSEAQGYAVRACNDPLALDAAVLIGTAWIDLGRLQDAERVLAAAGDAARAAGEQPRLWSARLSLARCLFWQGRYEEADQLLASMDPALAGRDAEIQLAIASSRVAVARRDSPRALTLASHALTRARESGNPALVARAACVSAFVHLVLGDGDTVSRDTHQSVAAARAARDPLRALRARLLEAEHARRQGETRVALGLLRRMQRITTLPPVLSARCALLADLVAAPADVADVVKRHVRSRGLPALALFASADAAAAHADDGVSDVLEVLQMCQVAHDDGHMLADVCRRLRARLRAAAIAVFVPGPAAVTALASDGGRLDSGIAARVLDARLTLPPHRHGAGVEGGAPIRYGSDVIGALVARWPIDADVNVPRSSMILTMSATAAAPAVAECAARAAAPGEPDSTLLGVSDAMREVRRAIERAAHAPFAVLIEGESGSGKELAARAIHRGSARRKGPWCAVNCAALPDDLVESELFGHARGAFTGASTDRPGVFEEAHGGTLFMDEVGELSPRAQAKLLRTIQEGEVRRVGENVPRRVDVRLVSATNRDLRQEVASGRFRQDLLYRLDVVRVTLPPLRDRREDVQVLAEAFWRDAAARVGSRATLGHATLAALARHDWPGNARELQNVLAALAVRSPRRGVIPPAALPPSVAAPGGEAACRLSDARRIFDERFVRAALARTGGHRARAATELGVTRQGLVKLMSRLGITNGEPSAD